MSEKLKSCPFCGGKAILREYQEESDGMMVDRGKEATCVSCPASIAIRIVPYDGLSDATALSMAVTLWNRRAR